MRAAAGAFPAWRATPILERVDLCRRAYTLCMERNEEIAQMITREMGKTIRESREEMEEYTADHFRRASEDILRHAGQVLPSTQERAGTKRILVVQEPVGVVAAVTPWNFPVDIAGIPIVYGLAAGCTVVWKPSEFAPLCAGMFVELLEDAGFPAGTVNLVHGRGETGSQLVRHPDVASVVFTGSVATGEQVARDAGLKNRVLELGGNGPQIVLADADIDKAADAAITGCFYLAGQCCTAAERILVHSSVQDAFVAALVERVAKLRVGDPLDDATDMGPLSTPATLERTKQHVADAVAKGATVVAGGGSDGQYHEPTVLTGVTSDMRIAQEETFGPVAPIMRFETLDEALDDRQRDRVRVDGGGVHERPARRLARGRGAAPRHRAHQRDHQLLGSDGAVRRRQEVGRRPRAGGLDHGCADGDEADHVRTGLRGHVDIPASLHPPEVVRSPDVPG